MRAVQWCSRLYTGDSAFFSPCLGWPSPKATTKSLTFLTGAVICHRAQHARKRLHFYLAQVVTCRSDTSSLCAFSQMSLLYRPDSADDGSLQCLARLDSTSSFHQARWDRAAHCEVLKHVKLLTDNKCQLFTERAGYLIEVMVWFASSMLLV